MDPPSPEPTRLSTELDLLTAIYPDQITYNPSSRDLKYTQSTATLHLRLPDSYPSSSLPDVIAATSLSKTDIRDHIKKHFTTLNLSAGEESLDALIAAFQDILENTTTNHSLSSQKTPSSDRKPNSSATKTVIIWLHHLLNTNKRKLALSPSSPLVSGLTKPGYPGIILYTGPAAPINEHVALLKQQNWQAFQVRYEEDGEKWELGFAGVSEVESMSEVVKMIGGRKEEFLMAVGIK